MKIGELAAATGTQAETIRYYEREGLLPGSTRTDSNYRVYNQRHLERLLFIRRCRTLDMTLNEIRALLQFNDAESNNCGEVNALLDEHIRHVADRIRELRKLEKQLKDLRQYCSCRETALNCGEPGQHGAACLCEKAEGKAHCGILTELFRATPEMVSGELHTHTHVPGSHSCT